MKNLLFVSVEPSLKLFLVISCERPVKLWSCVVASVLYATAWNKIRRASPTQHKLVYFQRRQKSVSMLPKQKRRIKALFRNLSPLQIMCIINTSTAAACCAAQQILCNKLINKTPLFTFKSKSFYTAYKVLDVIDTMGKDSNSSISLHKLTVVRLTLTCHIFNICQLQFEISSLHPLHISDITHCVIEKGRLIRDTFCL